MKNVNIVESRGHQTDTIANHEFNKLEDVLESRNTQIGKSERKKGHRKVKEFGRYLDAPQESIHNYEADEYDENGKRRIIKVEQFECSDDILPQIAVEHCEPERGIENQTKVSVKLEQYYGKLQNLSGNRIYRMEENKRNEEHRKVTVDEFGHNVRVPQESKYNFEADEYEENGKRRIIKVEKFECIDDILPQIAVEHCEPKQSIENQTKVSVKLEQYYGKLQNLSGNRIYRMEENKRNEEHRKVTVDEFGHNVRVPQESKYNFEADEYEENGKRRIIKVEQFECRADILPQIAVEHYDQEQSKENQTKVSVNLENHCDKLENLSVSKNYQIEKSKRNEGHRKVKVDKFGLNVEEPQESACSHELDQYEGNEKGMLIKVEKFECSDDILPQIAVEHYDPEQSKENQSKVSVKLENHCDKLENLSVSKNYQIEESKRNEGRSKVKVDKFGLNVEEPQESAHSHESDQYEGDEKGMLIKVEKFECSDDILPHIAVEHCEPKQSIENQTNVLVKLEHHCNKLSQISQVSLYQPEKYKGNKKIEDCTTVVASAVCEVSSESNSSRKTVSRQRRRVGVLSENQNRKVLNKIDAYDNKSDNYEDTVYSELSQDDDNISALEKLFYKCDNCRYVTVIKESLVTHMKLHNYKQSDSICESELQLKNQIISEKYEHIQIAHKLFACNLCSYKSAFKSKLQRHQLTHNGEKPFACNLCSYKSAHKSNLMRHQLKHTGEKPFPCNLCSYKSARRSSLEKHRLQHTGEKLFGCNLCSYKSARRSSLEKHQHQNTGEKPFACNLCSYKSVRRSSLEKHQFQHTGEKLFGCNLCSYKTARKYNLKKHLLKHTGEKPFACSFCSYMFAQKSHLKKHQLKHTGEKPFACNLCSYKSALKSNLQTHQLTHTGEKPFACKLCSYKCAQKSHLKKHQLKHTGEKPFACNLCSYKCAQKSHLKKHQLKHTGEKPFACNLCSYKCAQKSHLKKHQLKHTGEMPFACNLCSYKCAQKSNLQRHQLTHTG